MTVTGRVRQDGAESAGISLILAHGAGAPMDSPFLERIATELASRGDVRVLRFEFPYMAARRSGERRPPDREPVLRETWRRVVESHRGSGRLVIGGKSLGGRIASLVADELAVDGLVCLGYPFHPPGKPTQLRTRHLASLQTPTLIVQGTRDTLGDAAEVAAYELSPAIRVVWLEDGDHSFKPRKRSGRTEEQNLSAAIDAVRGFLRGGDGDRSSR